jgi:hypothetical protein
MGAKRIGWILGIGAGLLGAGMAVKAADAEKPSIGHIMKKAFKGENSLEKKVAQNKASDAERKQFLDFVTELTKQTPDKGAPESWKDKTTKLLRAAESAAKNEPGAGPMVEKAANCKSCHTSHREE